MPKAQSKSPSKTPDVKPYLHETEDHLVKPVVKKEIRKRDLSRPWTDQERLTLFRIAITKGASIKNFEDVLEGRTGHLCYCQW